MPSTNIFQGQASAGVSGQRSDLDVRATETPWWTCGVIYQIYPRSFADSNGDGVGDLAGIVDRLDYLNDGSGDSLGVNAIWISPFYPSPMDDFGYDVANYVGVHPIFGTLDDFDHLVVAAHSRNIKVIIDWVPNHTSHEHPWFAESRSSKDSKKRDWYVWRDCGPDGGPPNNWRSFFPRVGSAWTFDDATGEWYLHSFMPQQPDLNWDNPEVCAAMYNVLRFWLDRGIDGFRIDAVPLLGKDPERRDNSADLMDPAGTQGAWGAHNINWPTIHDRLKGIRRVIDEHGGHMIVGEVNVRRLEDLAPYVNTGDELNLAHNFMVPRLPWKASAFRELVDTTESIYSSAAWPTWYLGNHDDSRLASRYNDGKNGPARARTAAVMLMTLRGTPFVYQGEELGLADVPVPPDRQIDIDGRDPARSPVPWEAPSSAGPGAGFTSSTPWLPITRDAEVLNVARQAREPQSMLSLYRALIAHRAGSVALRRGSYRSLHTCAHLFAYLREMGSERVLVALNFQDTAHQLSHCLDVALADVGEIVLSSDCRRPRTRSSLSAVTLSANEGVIIDLTS